MADNLQDFLKRAAAKRQQQAEGGPPPIDSVRANPPAIQPSSPAPFIEIVETERVPAPEIVETERVLAPSLSERVAANVSSHVQQHLNSDAYDQRAAQMGDRVEGSHLDSHMHEVFDHQVGDLAQTSYSDDVYDDDTSDDAYQISHVDHYETQDKKPQSGLIADLLASPKNIRQAFIFSEIIKPPSDRWED